MKPIWARLIKPEEVPQAIDWIGQNAARNHVDAEVLTYPSTFAMAAQKQGSPIMYMPIQRPFMLESVGFDPESSKLDQSVALREIVHSLVQRAQQDGVGEIYFLGSDIGTSDFAKRHGFEELNCKMFRLKINSLP